MSSPDPVSSIRSLSRLFLFLILLSSSRVLAQAKPPQVLAGTPDLSKQAWVIDHLVTSITLEDSGKDVREVTAEIKVLQEAGVKQFAVLNFTFTRANETVDVDYVRVRKPDGSVVTTPEYNIQDMPADITRTAPMYSDIHEKHVAVKGLGIGDTLEYRIHYRTLTPQIPGQAWYAFNMSKSEIIRDERIELTVPKAKHITVKSPEFKPEISDQGDLRTYKWKYTNLQLKEDEQTASNRTTPPPDVQVSTFASWDEIGHWYSELQHDRVTVTPALAAKAAELTKGLTTDDAKLRALYDFVSLHIHYVGLDFGVGRFQPHSADDVLSNEYGDCKDKHTLLAALLHAAGFEAWPVLIHSSQKLDPEVPSPAQFDHVITAVPVGQNLVWLDTTAEVAPYGLLMPQLRDKQALVIATGKPAVIMSTPANPPFPQEQRFEAKAKLGSDGVLHAHITQQYRGDVEVALRATLRQIPEARWQEAIQGFSRGIGFAGDVSDVVISPIDDLDKPLVISYDYLRKDYADWEHKQILTLLPPIGIEGSASDSAKQPKEPLYMGAVGDLVYHSEIELPPGSSLTPPKDVNLVEPYAEYHTQNVFEGGKLETTRRLLLKKTEVPVADWDSFKKMAKAASDDSFNYIPLRGLDSANSTTASSAGLDLKFKEAADALQQRDSRRAMELLQQVIAADPKYRGAHFNLAFAFAQSGRADDALEELQKEEEVNPDDPRSYQAAASLAVFARKRDLAVAQLQKLLKLDPKNRDGAIRLASLLSEEGKDKESVEVLEPAVRLSPDSSSLQFALGTAYLKTEDAAKAVPHLQSAAEMAEKAAPLDYMQLNNIAYSLADANADLELSKHCIEKALTELDARSNSDPTDPQSKMELTRDHALLWDTAGWIYFRLGDLKAAEDYVRAAWVLGQDGVVGEHLGEIYERLGMKKEAARTYELAVAAMPIPPAPYMAPPRMGNNLIGTESALKLAKSRYQKLMGKQMNINSFDRLPNGTWPVSPFDELNQLRTAKLGTQPGPDGYADFEVKFDSKGSQVATFLTGNSAMKSLTKRLELAKFKVEFPAGSKAVLYRRVTVHCSKLAPCSAVVLPSNIVFAPPT